MKYLIFIILFSLASCDIQKTKTSEEAERFISNQTESINYRRGDTVRYRTQVHVKDTTIYTINRQGTTLKTVYDSQGRITDSECIASSIAEILRQNQQMYEAKESSTKDKSESFNTAWIAYIVVGLVVMFLIFMLIMVWKLSSITKTITNIKSPD